MRGKVPVTSFRGLDPSCDLPFLSGSISSHRDQHLDRATCPTNSNLFELKG